MKINQHAYSIIIWLLISGILFPCECVAQNKIIDDVIAYLDKEKVSIPEGGQLDFAIVEDSTFYTFGLIKNEGELRLSENDTVLFEIGSITKVISASLLVAITSEKSIALSDKIDKYLPGDFLTLKQADYLKTISLQDLASHYSGLPRDPIKAKEYVKRSSNPWSLYDLDELKFDLENSKLKGNSGSKYNYSNVGYSLLGVLLEEIQEDNYENLLTSRIIQPAKMNHTYLSSRNNSPIAPIQGYDVKGKVVDNWTFDIASPAGGVVSCSRDMANFLIWNMDSQNEIANTCHKPIGKGQVNGTLFSYVGLGWNIIDTDLFKRFNYKDNLIWHNGATSGFQSYIGFLKGNKKGIVVLSNFRSKKRHSVKLGEYLLGKMNE